MTTRRAFLLGAAAVGAAPWARADEDPWRRLRGGGLVILMRHASAGPGPVEPAGFRLGDCATQLNLSQAGRDEARRIGARMAAQKVPIARVYTSPWCRCRDTAILAFGKAEDWEPLSSFIDHPRLGAGFTESVRKRIGGYGRRDPGGNVVMVTHDVNIAALTGHSIAPAEMVLVKPDGCCNARPVERLKIA